MRIKHQPEHLQFVRENAPKMSREELKDALNEKFGLSRTLAQVRSLMHNNKIPTGKRKVPAPTLHKPEHLEFLRKNYPLMSQKKLTEALNKEFGLERTPGQVLGVLKNYKITSGRDGRFEGADDPRRCTTGATGPNAGTFKKGQVPINLKPLGHERVDKNGFLLVKIPEKNPYTGAATRYQFKHIYLWEQAHGKVPSGHAVAFRDGDKANCVLENLMLITRAELLQLNKHGYSSAPSDIKPVLLTLAKLEVATFALKKSFVEEGTDGSRVRAQPS